MTSSLYNYPRPDFVSTNLNWSSLNGEWNFLFDDDDVGQLLQWHRYGLPENYGTNSSGIPRTSDSNEISKKIAALPENSSQDNSTAASKSGKEYVKQQIVVPYVFQCPASGINNRDAHEVIWYERRISDIRSDEDIKSNRQLLVRFGAVDYEATVWLDGQYVGRHRGGHVPFDVNISDVIEGKSEARLTLRVYDSPSDLTQPRGKQYWAAQPEKIFYTPSSGIWQSVWLESVPQTRIGNSSQGTILRSSDIENGRLKAYITVIGRRAGQPYTVEVTSSFEGNVVDKVRGEVSKDVSHVNLDVSMRLSSDQLEKLSSIGVDKTLVNSNSCWRNGVALWSPDHPSLYDITIRLLYGDDIVVDEIKTTTGMRSLDWSSDDGTFKLNGRPYFQALVLDQGYWPETFLTPPSPESLKRDIEMSKNMGFNGCRKHQKVEDPIYLYWADKLGYLVWGEMANAYEFSPEYVDRFDQEWMESVRRDINHPSIVTWTPVNETWGYPALKDNVEQQNHIRSLYYMTKTLDPTRPINDNCGWEHVCTDLTTFHDYSDGPELAKVCSHMDGILDLKDRQHIMFIAGAEHRKGAPIICTEFGGVNIAPAKGDTTGDRDWGYTTASDPEDLLKRVERLVMGIVEGGHCCGFVYTQLTDIEQEVNGLYTFNRRPKLEASKVKKIMDKAQAAYYKSVGIAQEVST